MSPHPDPYAQLWWAFLIVVGFGAPETYWLLTRPRDTLSDVVWYWCGVRTGVPVWQWNVAHLALLGLLLWLVGHLGWGIWR